MPDISLLEAPRVLPYVLSFLVLALIVLSIYLVCVKRIEKKVEIGDMVVCVAVAAMVIMIAYVTAAGSRSNSWVENVYNPWVESLPTHTTDLITVKGKRGIALPDGYFYRVYTEDLENAQQFVSPTGVDKIDYKFVPAMESPFSLIEPMNINFDDHIIVTKLYSSVDKGE